MSISTWFKLFPSLCNAVVCFIPSMFSPNIFFWFEFSLFLFFVLGRVYSADLYFCAFKNELTRFQSSLPPLSPCAAVAMVVAPAVLQLTLEALMLHAQMYASFFISCASYPTKNNYSATKPNKTTLRTRKSQNAKYKIKMLKIPILPVVLPTLSYQQVQRRGGRGREGASSKGGGKMK